LPDDRQLAATVVAETPRLRAFVRRHVGALGDVDDIVQDTFAELVTAYRLLQPIEHVAGWLLRVARNRIVDGFRRQARRGTVVDRPHRADGAEEPERVLETWLDTSADGPEAAYAREVLVAEFADALEALPAEQREVFVAHELDGHSFKTLATRSGVSVNTLIGRKHAAVLQLRRRLQALHDEFDW
jgi:RNA polymerase sigma factor (sigma-70 family)